MPRRPRQHSPFTRLAALASGCALALLCASIATARPDHGGHGEGQGQGQGQGQRQGEWHGDGHGRGKEAAEAPPAGAGHGHDGGGSGGGDAEHGQGQDRGEHRKDHGSAGDGGGDGQGAGAAAEQGSGSAPGKDKATGAPQTRTAGAAARSSAPSTPAARPTRPAASTPAAAAAPAPAATAPVALAQPSAIPASPSAAAPSASSSRSQPSSHDRSRRPARNVRRNRAAVGRALATALTPVALAAGAPAPAAQTGHAGAAARGRRAHRVQPATSQPPIVETITRIVGVVPLAVWIAGGALAALALALAIGSRLLAKRARRLERQRGELLADVGVLQTALLPAPPTGAGPLSASVAFKPADGPAAGGDFYDVFTLEGGTIAAIVGDVSGHGREALPHTALVRFTLRAYLEAGLSPREALSTAGAVLERQLEGALATAVLATYHPRERTLVYASAGHPPPIVLGRRPLQPLAASSAPPIGAGMTTGTRQTVVSLPGAAQVCLHTDGVTDARAGSELYGSERLARALAGLGPRATASQLLERVSEQTDARPDDMAACLLSLQGKPAEPVTLVQELELHDGANVCARAERFLLACGLDLGESARVAREACARAEQTGSALIEARPSGPGAGAPSARVRRDEEPDIHASDTRRLATVGGSR